MGGIVAPNSVFDGTRDFKLAYVHMQNSAKSSRDDSALLREHEGLLLDMARRFNNRSVQVDDLMQIGRIALVNALRGWRHQAALWTYARRSVLRDMIRFATSEEGQPSRPISSHDGPGVRWSGERDFASAKYLVDSIPDEQPSPLAALESDVREDLAVEAMNELSDLERVVIHLRFVDELAVRAVAIRLGISKSEIDRISQAAISKLRSSVEASL